MRIFTVQSAQRCEPALTRPRVGKLTGKRRRRPAYRDLTARVQTGDAPN